MAHGVWAHAGLAAAEHADARTTLTAAVQVREVRHRHVTRVWARRDADVAHCESKTKHAVILIARTEIIKKRLTVRRSVTFGRAAHQHTFLERAEVQQRARVVNVRGGGGRGRGRRLRLRRRGGRRALALAFSLWLFRLCADRGGGGEWRSAGAPSRGDHRDATGVEQPSRGGQRPGERRGYRGNSGCAMCARRCETLEANTSSDRSISSPSKTSIEERFVTPPRCGAAPRWLRPTLTRTSSPAARRASSRPCTSPSPPTRSACTPYPPR